MTGPLRPNTRLADDLADAGLAEACLQRRMTRVVNALSQRPDQPYPVIFGERVDELYELANDDALSFETPFELHGQATAQRIEDYVRSDDDGDEVLVLHDTTECTWTLRKGSQPRRYLSKQSSSRQGFRVHLSMAVAATAVPCPLGYLAVQPYVHQRDVEALDEPHRGPARQFWQRHGGWMSCQSQRWAAGVERSAARLSQLARSKLIHVADAEGDIYELFAGLLERHDRFVVAVAQSHRIVLDDDGRRIELQQWARHLPHLVDKQVQLKVRYPDGVQGAKRKADDVQRTRTANLQVRAGQVRLARPTKRRDLDASALSMYVVELFETDPPPDQAPVHWLLLTSERVESDADALRVSRWYETRWLIEEANQALKTGCSYEKRQLRCASSLLMVLGLTLPIALDLLLLRYLARRCGSLSARSVLSRQRLAVLMAVSSPGDWSETPTLHEAMMAIARLGGHLKRNGRPGWKVLARGLAELLICERAWVAAQRDGPGADP